MSAANDTPRKPIQPAATLGAMHANGYAITFHCEVCGHSGPLDLPGLIERFGPETPTDARSLLRWMRCGNCGFRGWKKDSLGRGVALTLHPPT